MADYEIEYLETYNCCVKNKPKHRIMINFTGEPQRKNFP
jgi:hypothetical protein